MSGAVRPFTNFVVACLCGVALAPGCGGSDSTTKPSPVPTSIRIAPETDYLLLGETLQLSATLTLSNGTTSQAAGTWGSDNTSVATVDSAGKVTAVGLGQATVYVDAQGVRGTRLLTSYVNVKGTWRGRFRIANCSWSFDRPNGLTLCLSSLGGGDSLELRIAQDRRNLSGTVDLGGFPGSLTGQLGDDGSVTIASSVSTSSGVIFAIEGWNTRTDTPDSMTGEFKLRITAPSVPGYILWDNRLVAVTRVSTTTQVDGLYEIEKDETGAVSRALRAMRPESD